MKTMTTEERWAVALVIGGVFAAACALWLMCNVPALGAQTPTSPTFTVEPVKPFLIAWDHDGIGASFRLWCGPSPTELAIVKNFATNEITKTATGFTATAPALVRGRHHCAVSAYNEVGEVRGAPVVFIAGTAPTAPTNLRAGK